METIEADAVTFDLFNANNETEIPLGSASVQLSELSKQIRVENWLPLQNSSQNTIGKIFVDIWYKADPLDEGSRQALLLARKAHSKSGYDPSVPTNMPSMAPQAPFGYTATYFPSKKKPGNRKITAESVGPKVQDDSVKTNYSSFRFF